VHIIVGHLVDVGGPRAELVTKASNAMTDALAALRSGVRSLEPIDVANGRLADALRRHACRVRGGSTISIRVLEHGAAPIGAQARALYHIGREAITNAVRHASPSTIDVTIELVDDHHRLVVTDDGKGFAGDTAPLTSMGLRSMRERAHAAGGEVSISSQIDVGTTVEVTVPISFAAPPESGAT
jgi:signal transduction histidine kinase